MTHYTRDQWGARASKGRTSLEPGQVRGIALHWPAMSKPIHDTAGVKAALRSWQAYHQGKGWSDIAYQGAVDQDGNTYELRGLKTRSAANGDTVPNQQYGALLLILAPGENPSEAMVASVRHEIARFREFFPAAREIKGHAQVRPEPTACPGPAALDYIRRGLFEPTKEQPKPTPVEPTPPNRGELVEEARAALRKAKAPEGTQREALLKKARRALRQIPFLGGNKS